MNWTGKWKNQYGSVIHITTQDGERLEGTFQSAVDETTKGQQLPLTNFCKNNLLAVSCAGGNHVVTYAGMCYGGKLETVWHVVTGDTLTAKEENEPAVKKPLARWQSVTTNADTFERME
ncbi:MAG: hypothetical protein INR73_26655 [Williamsia sp.]|nr:hypothetical protein [Williamsia sp.]